MSQCCILNKYCWHSQSHLWEVPQIATQTGRVSPEWRHVLLSKRLRGPIWILWWAALSYDLEQDRSFKNLLRFWKIWETNKQKFFNSGGKMFFFFIFIPCMCQRKQHKSLSLEAFPVKQEDSIKMLPRKSDLFLTKIPGDFEARGILTEKPCEAFGTVSSSSSEESGSVSNRTGWSSEMWHLVTVQASWLSDRVWKKKSVSLCDS